MLCRHKIYNPEADRNRAPAIQCDHSFNVEGDLGTMDYRERVSPRASGLGEDCPEEMTSD